MFSKAFLKFFSAHSTALSAPVILKTITCSPICMLSSYLACDDAIWNLVNIFIPFFVKKYLCVQVLGLLIIILVKNSMNNSFWSKFCSKLNFRQNLFKADISIKRTFFSAPMVSALEGFHCSNKIFR